LGLRFCLCRSDPGKEEVETQAVEAMTKVAGPRLRASRELDAEARKKDLRRRQQRCCLVALLLLAPCQRASRELGVGAEEGGARTMFGIVGTARACQQMTGAAADAVAETMNGAGPAPTHTSSEGAWAAAAASTKVADSEWRRTELGRCLASSSLADLPLSDPR